MRSQLLPCKYNANGRTLEIGNPCDRSTTTSHTQRFTAALGIPTLDGLGADGKGAHAACEQIYFSSLMPRTHLCARLLETPE
jgi:glutamate carboxypeptidase